MRNDAAKSAAGPSPSTSGGSTSGSASETTSGEATGDGDGSDLYTEEEDINTLIEPEPEKNWEDMVTEEAEAEKSGPETGKK